MQHADSLAACQLASTHTSSKWCPYACQGECGWPQVRNDGREKAPFGGPQLPLLWEGLFLCSSNAQDRTGLTQAVGYALLIPDMTRCICGCFLCAGGLYTHRTLACIVFLKLPALACVQNVPASNASLRPPCHRPWPSALGCGRCEQRQQLPVAAILGCCVGASSPAYAAAAPTGLGTASSGCCCCSCACHCCSFCLRDGAAADCCLEANLAPR